MKNPTGTTRFEQILALPLVAALLVLGGYRPADAADSQSIEATVSLEQQRRLEVMKKKGTDTALTILPVRLAGRPFDRLTEVVGLLLEQQGLKNIDLGKSSFEPADKAGLETLAGAVGEFVRKHPITTEYALYAEYNGSPQTGLNELRAIVTDQAGAIVWMDRQTGEDAAFKRLGCQDPMAMSVLLIERLGPQMGLNEETAKAAKPGRMARLMDERSGMPPEDERTPLPARQKEMKKAMPGATLLIFPVRVGGNEVSLPSATELANMINGAGLCKAAPAAQSVLLKASQADPNEQKTLWDLAREFRDYAKKNPVDADYVLYADFAFTPEHWEQGFVHFIVCDRKGEWVIVDFQNSHHPDYQSIKPTSREGCDKLLVKRLEGYLR